MELQSRFGTDERFRMDSRFLEDDEKEEEESGEGVAVEERSSYGLYFENRAEMIQITAVRETALSETI